MDTILDCSLHKFFVLFKCISTVEVLQVYIQNQLHFSQAASEFSVFHELSSIYLIFLNNKEGKCTVSVNHLFIA